MKEINDQTCRRLPLRVDFAGGWLDVPSLARAASFIVNCTIDWRLNKRELESDPRLRGSGLGTSAAFRLLTTPQKVLEMELAQAGWQDPAVILETGLCVWRSGPLPVLQMKINPRMLDGVMALRYTGDSHHTKELTARERDYDLIMNAGHVAWHAVKEENLEGLRCAVERSYKAQLREGMAELPALPHAKCKYCGAGWGGWALYVFDTQEHRAEANDILRHSSTFKLVEPYIESTQEKL